jgi:hypothetical protein
VPYSGVAYKGRPGAAGAAGGDAESGGGGGVSSPLDAARARFIFGDDGGSGAIHLRNGWAWQTILRAFGYKFVRTILQRGAGVQSD